MFDMRKLSRMKKFLIGIVATVLAGCGSTSSASAPTSTSVSPRHIGGVVRVAYAGSLVGAMVNDISPAFHAATGITFEGLPGGSTALVNQIKSGTQSFDVFISAAPSANEALMGTANGSYLTWYAALGTSPLEIGYNPSSRFAAALKAGPWYKVMAEPGFALGRTDPALDPKGVLVEKLLTEEASALGDPSLVEKVLGATENPSQVFPEETLVARLQTGQLDAGFFYANEADQAKIPTIATGINLGADFTVSILSNAKDLPQAVAFVNFLYSAQGSSLLDHLGVKVGAPTITGAVSKVPKGLHL